MEHKESGRLNGMKEKGLSALLEEASEMHGLINEKRPFDRNQLQQLMKYYRPLMTWSSNALEGNTIPLSETQMILEDGVTIHGHTLREINECVGHGEAFDYMFSLIRQKYISEEDIKRLHYLFARNIKDIPCPGEYRDVSKTYVYITGSEYPCPDYSEVPGKMRSLAEWVNTVRDDFHPVELAADFHRKFVYIHPFPDGNGRVSRLLMNTILLQEGYMPVLISPEHKPEYIRLLEEGRIQPSGFTEFIAERELEQQKKFMKFLNISTDKPGRFQGKDSGIEY